MRTQVRVVKTRGSATWAALTKNDKERSQDNHPQKPLRPAVFTGFGYIDILICWNDNGLRSHVIGEVKNTNWDLRKPTAVVPLLGRHRRQVWGYLEPMLFRVEAAELVALQGSLIYPSRPTSPGLSDEIAGYLLEYGLTAEYADELVDKDTSLADDDSHRLPCVCGSMLRELPVCEICQLDGVKFADNARLGETRSLHAMQCPSQRSPT